MTFAYENIRLNELAAIAELNKDVYDDFERFLQTHNFQNIYAFVLSEDDQRTERTLLTYLQRPLPEGVELFDGIARPYAQDKAKWLFLGWLLRDAPEQRLRPMVASLEGANPREKRAKLLNIVRKGLASSFSEPEHWTWYTTREVIIDRLEGSRRAIKGTLFEAIVRRILAEAFDRHSLSIEILKTEIRLEGETYDVSVKGEAGTVLMPVKTRETMGGGHALLFTRDIHKSISVAHGAGYECVPIVIAESWAGDLDSLEAQRSILIGKNPNQIKEVEPILEGKIDDLIPFLAEQCLKH